MRSPRGATIDVSRVRDLFGVCEIAANKGTSALPLFLVFQEIYSVRCTVAARASTGGRPLPNRLPQPLTTIARSPMAYICNPRPVDAYTFMCEDLLCGA